VRVSLSLSLSNFQLQGVADFYGFLWLAEEVNNYLPQVGEEVAA
jgi:hypothetical protein